MMPFNKLYLTLIYYAKLQQFSTKFQIKILKLITIVLQNKNKILITFLIKKKQLFLYVMRYLNKIVV